ncbi:PQQ-like domain-containing protein [Nocardia nova SH22a]|uniref:PQQ-like domain-containing protein n=1 Tax=Nocardia nova SH22a TaxID=1415166 RepID=W5TRK0_9NOCA|nr:PQQ-binding-like beta-propeller repeat protein [Nocardia nova]AHH21872.1 PQQ-like domain-containing protein [Nocardia nova SH22a]
MGVDPGDEHTAPRTESATDTRQFGWGARIFAVLGAFGCGLVLGATALAAYSVWGASRLTTDDRLRGHDLFGSFDHLDPSGIPGHFGLTALIAGPFVLMVAVIAVLRVRRRWSGYAEWWPLVLMSMIGGLLVAPIMAAADHLPGVWRQVRVDHPLFEQLPTGVVAAGSVVLATVFMIPVVFRPGLLRAVPWRGLGIVTVAGALVATAAAAASVVAGDDNRHVDRGTAAATAAPPVPDRAGSQRYQLQVPSMRDRGGWYDSDIVATGTGFVVGSTDGITAYDGVTGTQRWHYLRTHNRDGRGGLRMGYRPGSLRSLDGGSVVLANWEHLGWLAFDAITGRTLWQNSEFAVDGAEESAAFADSGAPLVFRTSPGYLLLTDRDTLTRYDAHTGKRLWTSHLECPDRRTAVAITDRALYRMAECSQGAEDVLTATALDPGTGTVLATRELRRTETNESAGRYTEDRIELYANTAVLYWLSAPRTYDQLIVPAPEQLTTATRNTGEYPTPMAADPSSGQVLSLSERRGTQPDHFPITDAITNVTSYELPGVHPYRQYKPADTAFLSQQMIQVGQDNPSGVVLRTWDRADGHPEPPTPITSECTRGTLSLITAPGAVLAVCTGKNSAKVFGYHP